MLATFERIRREIEDLHLAYVGGVSEISENMNIKQYFL